MLNCLGLFKCSLSLSAQPLIVFSQGMCPYALSADAGIVQCVNAAETLSVHAQVPFDYPGKLRYYSVRASATGQPTKSVQCNPIVEAEV